MSDFKPQLSGISEPPNAELIAWLESALESAKSGDLRNVLAVGIWRGRVVTTGFCDGINFVMASALGGLRMLEHELISKCERTDAGMVGR
jgi:hypothetical protein